MPETPKEITKPTQGAKVSELWWQDDTLHVITEEGVHTAFKGAWMISRQVDQGMEHFVQITAACPWGHKTSETVPDAVSINMDDSLGQLLKLSDKLKKLANMDPINLAGMTAEQL
jgi:hypothetical protein